MNRMRTAARAAGILVFVTGAVVGAAAPALAGASPPQDEAYALQAAGAVVVQQAGAASYSGGSPVVLPNVDAAGLLRTGPVTDRATAVSAASRLPAVVLTLPGHAVLRARSVASSCRYAGRPASVSGSARITGGVVQAGRHLIRLPASAAPNTRIIIPGSAVIMLNRQFTGPAGTLTVAALRVRMLRGHQKVLLATSVCAAADLAPAPGAGGPAARLAIGGLGLAALAALAWRLSRRQRAARWSPPAAGTGAGRPHAGTRAPGG